MQAGDEEAYLKAESKFRGIESKIVRKHGIGIRIHVGNPCCDIVAWEDMQDQPLGKLDVGVAEYSAKKCNLGVGLFDMSKPGEPAFSERTYVWRNSVNIETKTIDELLRNVPAIESEINKFVEEFKNGVAKVEPHYQQSLQLANEKLIERLNHSAQPKSEIEKLLES